METRNENKIIALQPGDFTQFKIISVISWNLLKYYAEIVINSNTHLPIAGLIKRRNITVPTALMLWGKFGNRLFRTWYKQWHILRSCNGNLMLNQEHTY